MKYLLFLITACSLNPEPVPTLPTEATELMIDTFESTTSKLTDSLARCMATVHACERMRTTVDAQIDAIFKVNKKDLCK